MIRALLTASIVLSISHLTLSAPATPTGRERVVGLPCEGCTSVFDGMPDEMRSAVRIAPENEPGEAMVIVGVVRDATGRPVEGVVVYAYHTNADGVYPSGNGARTDEAQRHGRFRAWARSDADGRYRFETIRPGSYPNTSAPQHVHMHIIEPGRCTYYIDDLHFDDDPNLTAAERRRPGRGGSGIATPARDESGAWIVTRDIVLGERVPGYPARP